MAATGSHGAGSASAITSAQVRSRPGTSGAGSCGRCTTTQRSGACAASSSAAARIGWYGTTRSASMPQEVATTTFGRASSIRTASSCAAKPPKTTECTAPIRAQASMAITASGTIAR